MQDILTEKGNAIILNATGNLQLTNCYFSYHELMNKITKQEIQCVCYEGIVILIHPIDSIHKIYYFLENRNALLSGLDRKIGKDIEKYQNLVGTVVARVPDKNVDILEQLGFLPYKKYIRKQMIPSKRDWSETSQMTDVADISDLNDIYQLVHGTFDIISDHLISKDELYDFLNSSRVLKVCIDGELAGVLLFETLGKKSYLHTICVAEKFMGKKVGLTLIENYIKRNQESTKLFYLWVESTNDRAIRLYDRFGYRDDGLHEYIYLYKDGLTTK